jgi:hypothetical protein
MRRAFGLLAAILILGSIAVSAQAQEKLQGRWEGKVTSLQGEMQTAATFKKEGAGYTGAITLMQRPSQFKDVKIEGDQVTAQSSMEMPQGNILVNYKLTLAGDKLTGKGEIDFGGQSFTLDLDLKKVSDDPAAAGTTAAAPAGGGQQRGQRPQVPQPQQKQSLDYFTGTWTLKWVGRESALGPGGPREGTITFKQTVPGKTLEGRLDARTEEGALSNTMVINWDEATKMMTLSERLSNGVQISSKGDWTSPISIRFTVEPIKVKGQTLMLRRTISVIAAHSFSITEELSEGGGPFVRLGNALFTKAGQ